MDHFARSSSGQPPGGAAPRARRSRFLDRSTEHFSYDVRNARLSKANRALAKWIIESYDVQPDDLELSLASRAGRAPESYPLKTLKTALQVDTKAFAQKDELLSELMRGLLTRDHLDSKSRAGCVAAVKALLDVGANPNRYLIFHPASTGDMEPQSAASIAERYDHDGAGFPELVALLEARGARYLGHEAPTDSEPDEEEEHAYRHPMKRARVPPSPPEDEPPSLWF